MKICMILKKGPYNFFHMFSSRDRADEGVDYWQKKSRMLAMDGGANQAAFHQFQVLSQLGSHF